MLYGMSLSAPLKTSLFWILEAWLSLGKPKQRKRLGIFKADGIGDFVLSSEAIRQLIGAHGPTNVCLIVSPEVQSLATALFPEVEALPIVPGHAALEEKIFGLSRLRSAVKAMVYDEVVCLRHYRTAYENAILRSLHTGRLVLLSNQATVGVDSSGALIPKNFHCVSPEASGTVDRNDVAPLEWQYHAAVLSASLGRGIRPQSMRPNWDNQRKPPKESAPFMLISPFTGSHIRDLPLNLVSTAAEQAHSNGIKHLVLTGTKRQAEDLNIYARALGPALPLCRVDVIHPTDLPALVDLVAEASLILTAETSTAHIATAIDKPALVLIGGGHYGWFAPWRRSEKQVWLTNRLPCFDCNWRCPYEEPLCITRISSSLLKSVLPIAEQK